ncbi:MULTISPECIES: cell division protein ZapA [unclassified Acetobacterium]|jgi:cell division protein ZapA|uniref:cell division protein ZapA n=1 Tax=unclassified Acetobacterium TaxID=2638182 RepID=UPI001FA8544D|nr:MULTISPECIES: cell division protein ZapA [unclassified Acetobacterium]MDZ5724594.1 cell division protein ZapA [Acetobacterium sp. K1/6]
MPEQTIMELRILDTEFNLKAKGNEEHIKLVSDYVNAELERVKAANPFTNHIRIAILGCMNITERLFIAEEEIRTSEEVKAKEIGEIKLVRDELEKTNDLLDAEKGKYETLAEEKELLQKELDEKNDLLAQYREHLRQSKIESETSRKTILDLQNQLFESQIELVKANKNHIEKDVFKNIEDKMKLE